MDARKLMILVVDDSIEDRQYLLWILEKSGLSFHVVEVSDMEEALTACQMQTFDCAILDFQLPGQDGLSGISDLKEQFPYIATIMVTGQGDEGVASEVIKRGAVDYIPKRQLNTSSLKQIIEYAIEKTNVHRQLDQQREELLNFSGVLVHDLKSPIHLIKELIELAQEKMLDQGINEEIVEYIAGVGRTANRLEALVDALAANIKFDANMEFHEVSLEESVAVAASILETSIKEKGAQVIFQDLPTIYGHEPQIIQLFQNLIANALKYNESDMPTITITSEKKDDMSHIFVQDNGIGISEKHYAKIFESFSRLHGNDSQYAGSGLGLATCKKNVERHGGTISCESVKGQGTMFILTFPSYSVSPVLT